MKNVVIKQDEKNPVPIEVLATSIRAIAAGIKTIRRGPLDERALLILIAENCRMKKRKYGRLVRAQISPGTIKSVLDSLESLQAAYLK